VLLVVDKATQVGVTVIVNEAELVEKSTFVPTEVSISRVFVRAPLPYRTD